MGSRIYLTNINSDVSGYLLALVDMRNPNLPATVANAITNSNSGDTNSKPMTATAGAATTLKWLTRKLSAAVTMGSTSGERWIINCSAGETGSAHNSLEFGFAQYTAGVQNATFLSDRYVLTQNPNTSIELTTSTSPNIWATTTQANWTTTSVNFAAGDRLAIIPMVARAPTGTGGGSVIMSYDGAAGAAGDTYVEVYSVLQVSQTQIGSTTTPGVKSKGVNYFLNLANAINDADLGSTTGAWLSDDTTLKAALNEANNQSKLV